MYSQERVFISHAGPQKGFALHLRTQLRHAGISTFVDARELQPRQQDPASAIMKAACEQAQLVVFLITRDFLRRSATVKELRWALAQRQKQPAHRQLPQLLTVLYLTSVLRSSRGTKELQQILAKLNPAEQLPGYAAELCNIALNDAAVDVDELRYRKLDALLRFYHEDAIADQAGKDLVTLAKLSVIRLDSIARCSQL